MRLAKYLASCGLGSRRSCEELLETGQIKVNCKVVTTPAFNIDPTIDNVDYKNMPLHPTKLVYYLLNKPIDYTATRKDNHAEKIVTELVPNNPPVWPVGRLDVATSGLLIMTNDGDLTNVITHPKYHKEKEYVIKTDRELSQEEIMRIRGGTNLEDGLIKPDLFEKIDKRLYRIIIHDGKKRIIRRLMKHYHKKTLSLERTRIEGLKIEKLAAGQYRTITPKEIKELLEDV